MKIPRIHADGSTKISVPEGWQIPKPEPKPDPELTIYAYDSDGTFIGQGTMKESDWDQIKEQDEW